MRGRTDRSMRSMPIPTRTMVFETGDRASLDLSMIYMICVICFGSFVTDALMLMLIYTRWSPDCVIQCIQCYDNVGLLDVPCQNLKRLGRRWGREKVKEKRMYRSMV